MPMRRLGESPQPAPAVSGGSGASRPGAGARALEPCCDPRQGVELPRRRRPERRPRGSSRSVGPRQSIELVAFFATYEDLVWVLDQKQRDLLLRLTPSSFDDDTATWALCLTQAFALNGDASGTRRYADEARAEYEAQLRENQTTPNSTRSSDSPWPTSAARRRRSARDFGPSSWRRFRRMPVSGPYFQMLLARIYTLVGEPDKAIDQLEPLLEVPCSLSPRWLAINPYFEPLRPNPRFQKLVAKK